MITALQRIAHVLARMTFPADPKYMTPDEAGEAADEIRATIPMAEYDHLWAEYVAAGGNPSRSLPDEILLQWGHEQEIMDRF